MKNIEIFSAVVGAVAAVASAYAALTLNNVQSSQNEFSERMMALQALSAWSKGHTQAGTHCMSMLNQFTNAEFLEFANRGSKSLKPDQMKFAARCFVGFKSESDLEKSYQLSDEEYSYVALQVLNQLNNYEALTLYWAELGPKSKDIICQQAKIDKSDAYRHFEKLAVGTAWWNYPSLGKFMEECS